MNKLSKIVSGLGLALASGAALAVPEANVLAATTAAQTAFTDSFGVVATLFVTISVTVALVIMAVKWFRRAAK